MKNSTLLESWIDRIAGRDVRIALADGDDPRSRDAAERLASLGIASVLLSDTERSSARGSISVMSTRDLAASDVGREVVHVLRERGKDEDFAHARAHDATYLAACLTRRGEAHATVAGSNRPTSDVLRAGLHVVGLEPGTATLSSCFILHTRDDRVLCFADCGVIPEPTDEQLADIATSSARTFAGLTGDRAAVALLSFSTKGSATHPSLDRLRRAREIAGARVPDLLIDHELQFDAALVESVARTKAPGSPVAGQANVFVFPDLASGNIGYKIAERLGGARSYGPLLQGLSRVVNDLSRGCDVEDVVNVAVISAVQALDQEDPAA
ncbi:phosphate acyltransferase [Aeromicrobium sp. CF4.19]|uniref:phosphate acyltransferase n=1 Tax=Aeromicrobium sp. CF4.19 TaxID=3373082 RepID=UPI003EE6E4F7